MKKTITLLFVTVSFLLNDVCAQNCPTISTSSPSSIKAGENAAFTVNLTGGKQGISVTYNWFVSAGIIESGQGTSVIYVNTNGLGGQYITATVEIGGLPADCSRTSSSSTSVDPGAPEAELHAKGDYTTAKLFTDEANKFAGAIMSGDYLLLSPRAIVYLYPGKNATAAAALTAMTKALKAAFAKYGLKSSAYKIITAGKRAQTSYEMWIVPEGAKEPEATGAGN